MVPQGGFIRQLGIKIPKKWPLVLRFPAALNFQTVTLDYFGLFPLTASKIETSTTIMDA
jgi:hypothetical protein